MSKQIRYGIGGTPIWICPQCKQETYVYDGKPPKRCFNCYYEPKSTYVSESEIKPEVFYHSELTSEI